jgi:hypothetical protein
VAIATYTEAAGECTYLHRPLDATGKTVNVFVVSGVKFELQRLRFATLFVKHCNPFSVTLDPMQLRSAGFNTIECCSRYRICVAGKHKRGKVVCDDQQAEEPSFICGRACAGANVLYTHASNGTVNA